MWPCWATSHGSLKAVHLGCLAMPLSLSSMYILGSPGFLPGFLDISSVARVLQDVGRRAAGTAQEARPARLR